MFSRLSFEVAGSHCNTSAIHHLCGDGCDCGCRDKVGKGKPPDYRRTVCHGEPAGWRDSYRSSEKTKLNNSKETQADGNVSESNIYYWSSIKRQHEDDFRFKTFVSVYISHPDHEQCSVSLKPVAAVGKNQWPMVKNNISHLRQVENPQTSAD